jgi:hypothetical protein
MGTPMDFRAMRVISFDYGSLLIDSDHSGDTSKASIGLGATASDITRIPRSKINTVVLAYLDPATSTGYPLLPNTLHR